MLSIKIQIFILVAFLFSKCKGTKMGKIKCIVLWQLPFQ